MDDDPDAEAVSNAEEATEMAPHVRGAPIVGIGASAGGIEAFLEMLAALPPDTGLAYVFVLHLTAQHVSSLPELLAGRTPIARCPRASVSERNRLFTLISGDSFSGRGAVRRTSPSTVTHWSEGFV